MKLFLKAALAGVLALILFTSPMQALIVYTPLRTTVNDNGSIGIDLNRDGTPDLYVALRTLEERPDPGCGFRRRFQVDLNVALDTPGSGVIGSPGRAYFLPIGTEVDSNSDFQYDARELLYHYEGCPIRRQASGYLGATFLIAGESHYGWTYVLLQITSDNHAQVTVKGYAYETIPSMGIVTGQLVGR